MIIGLSGRARVGKDTAAWALAPLGFARVAFADPMREMLRCLGLTDADMEGEAKERPVRHLGLSYRRLAQTLGTEWGRSLDPDLWVNVAMRRIDDLTSTGQHVVVTDVRFDNEATLIRSLGGMVWRIERDVESVASHASENGVNRDLIDAVIRNDGELDEFIFNVRSIVTELVG